MARRRGAARRVDDGARRFDRGAARARAPPRRHQTRDPGGGGASPLAAVHAVPLSAAARRIALSRARTIRACSTAPTRSGPPARNWATGGGATCTIRRRSTAMPTKPQTVFQVKIEIDAVDLRAKPFVRDRRRWTDAGDYRAARTSAARRARPRVGAIRYESVRDPKHAACCAVLAPAAFAPPIPLEQQTWMLSVARDRVIWQRTHALDAEEHEFAAAQWSPLRALGRTDYEPTWRAMQAFTAARARRHAGRDLAHRASAGLHARPRRPARAPAARQRHSGDQGRPRRAGHLPRPRATRRLSALRPAARASSASARWSGRSRPR